MCWETLDWAGNTSVLRTSHSLGLAINGSFARTKAGQLTLISRDSNTLFHGVEAREAYLRGLSA